MRFSAILKSLIMSYTYKGAEYIVSSPVQSISVNKLNVVVTDQQGSHLFTFKNVVDSKQFLAWVYQA